MIFLENECGTKLPTIEFFDPIWKTGSIQYPAESVLTDAECEGTEPASDDSDLVEIGNYWLLQDGQTGGFIIDTLCEKSFTTFYLKNTHNQEYMDR